MIEYEIISDATSSQLVKRVREWIERGWRPQGGVAIDGANGRLYQVMIHDAFYKGHDRGEG